MATSYLSWPTHGELTSANSRAIGRRFDHAPIQPEKRTPYINDTHSRDRSLKTSERYYRCGCSGYPNLRTLSVERSNIGRLTIVPFLRKSRITFRHVECRTNRRTTVREPGVINPLVLVEYPEVVVDTRAASGLFVYELAP